MACKLISIIIPFYNVEEFIEKSIRSVANQTYSNIEVIIVNDGSKDNSLKIVESVIANDNRFTIIHQENAGLSAARNSGLKLAKGDYIFYLDSDDFLINDAIEKLVNIAVNNDADVVQGNFYYDYPNYLLVNNYQKDEIMVFDHHNAMNALLDHQLIMNFAWGKLIKTTIAKSLPFPTGKYFEDTLWQTKLIHQSNCYITYKFPILYYLQRPTGISGQFSMRNLDQVEGEIQRLQLIKNYYPSLYNKALKIFTNKLIAWKENLSQLNKNDQIKFNQQLDHIVHELQLKKNFKYTYLILENRFLHKIQMVCIRIVNKIFKRNSFLKLNK